MSDHAILTPWERGVFKRALDIIAREQFGGLEWGRYLAIHNGDREAAAADYNVALADLVDLAEQVVIDVKARPRSGNRTAELYALAVECGFGVTMEDAPVEDCDAAG